MNDLASLAAKILQAGGLVAIPTETVYGLGADATNSEAIKKIFAAKGRPATNPLIVHVADKHIAKNYASAWPIEAEKLAAQFWPGPLTLVLPKTRSIVDEATAGRGTVGLRVPNHPLTLALLRAFGGAVAAPSANRSNHISPTSAADVRAELGDRVDLILDGGRCAVGIESTVLDLSTAQPTILRPGGISRQQIEAVIGPVSQFFGSVAPAIPATSPGQQSLHYAPHTPTFRFDRAERQRVLELCRGILLIAGQSLPSPARPDLIEMPGNPGEYATMLYRVLREADGKTPPAIYVELPPDEPRWHAVRDRLIRASTQLHL